MIAASVGRSVPMICLHMRFRVKAGCISRLDRQMRPPWRIQSVAQSESSCVFPAPLSPVQIVTSAGRNSSLSPTLP